MKRYLLTLFILMNIFCLDVEAVQFRVQGRVSAAYNTYYEEMEYVGRAWATMWLTDRIGISTKYQYNANVNSVTWQALEPTLVLRFLQNVYITGGWQGVWSEQKAVHSGMSESTSIIDNDTSWRQEDIILLEFSYRSQPESFTGITFYRNLDAEYTLIKGEADCEVPLIQNTSLYFEGNGRYSSYDNDIFSGLMDAGLLGGVLYTAYQTPQITFRILPFIEYRFPLTNEAKNVFDIQNSFVIGLRMYGWGG